MQQTNSSPTPVVTLDQRRALLWMRKHQPTPYPSTRDPDAPSHRTLSSLLRAGLIHFDPNRKKFDSPRFCLTARGNEVLGGS